MESHQIRVTSPEGRIRKVEVGADGLTIGSGKGADVVVEGDLRLSRRHGRLWLNAGEVWYEDSGSSYGSFLGDQAVSGPVCLRPGVEIRLSETHLTLDETPLAEVAGPVLPAGMTLRMQGRAGSDGLVESLGTTGTAVYVAAIYDIVERLLHATSRELIPAALHRLRTVVPAAQRVAVVAWPPDANGAFTSLLPYEERQMTPISQTLARYVVENKRAVLIADGGIAEGLEAAPSILGIRSAVYVPLVGPLEAVVGLLCVDSPSPTLPLTRDHFLFICAIGGLLASTLAADRLREDARRQQLDAEAVRARREALVSFLQIASHDLKNQLTAITNGARLLPRVQTPEQRDRLINVVLNAGVRATDLIKAYLDVSAVESGHGLTAEWSPVEPRRLFDEEMAVLQLALQDRLAALTIHNQLEAGVVTADERKLRQILSNLVSNAVKYSPAGGAIMVSSQRLPGEVRFHVQDQGVGISEQDQQKLFQAFQRVGDLNLAPGTGLGLWLTAALVAAQGGSIWVDSQPGQGATFSFNIPQSQG